MAGFLNLSPAIIHVLNNLLLRVTRSTLLYNKFLFGQTSLTWDPDSFLSDIYVPEYCVPHDFWRSKIYHTVRIYWRSFYEHHDRKDRYLANSPFKCLLYVQEIVTHFIS